MRVEPNRYNPSFKGVWNNRALLKGLETISEHGTTFVAATTLAMSTIVRPIAISATPNTNKETKKYASVNSIASGLTKFALVEAIAIPVENAVKKIDKNPETYLNSSTINNLKGNAKTLTQSQDYKFATQLIKMSTGLITAIPKAMITVALIPLIINGINKLKVKGNNKPQTSDIYSFNEEKHPIFSNDFNLNKQNKSSVSFKGLPQNTASKLIGNIINNSSFQTGVKNLSSHHEDIARNISMATDILLTASFLHRTKKSKNIDEDRKKALMFNNVISTGITLTAGYGIDNLVKKGTYNFIKKFSEINKNDPKLNKYIEGINIIRPTIIFAALYYGILPVISTYLADKADKFTQKDKKN